MRRSMEDKDQGFTLIELLVVMITIGILAAIAIPLYLNQRTKGYEATAKSDAQPGSNALNNYCVSAKNSQGGRPGA